MARLSGADAGQIPRWSAEDGSSLSRRFGGVERLYGARVMERFCTARVAVVGLGGVGSWAAEALARSGLACITLVDLDHVSESNTNRQIHALGAEFGKPKVQAMAERILAIHPGARIRAIEEFIDAANCAVLLENVEMVIDCIDDARAKAAMLAHARTSGIAVVTCGAAGGRVDPSRIRVADLGRVTGDPLLASVRHRLRRDHGFPGSRNDHRKPAKMGFEAVFSDEPIRSPAAIDGPAEDLGACEPGDVAGQHASPGSPLACAGYGSCVTVTASFGLIAAARALAHFASPAPTAAP